MTSDLEDNIGSDSDSYNEISQDTEYKTLHYTVKKNQMHPATKETLLNDFLQNSSSNSMYNGIDKKHHMNMLTKDSSYDLQFMDAEKCLYMPNIDFNYPPCYRLERNSWNYPQCKILFPVRPWSLAEGDTADKLIALELYA